jgi:subtilisin family serine protease
MLFGLALACAVMVNGGSEAGVVGRGAQSALESMGAGDEVSVIVHLSDRADISQFRNRPRGERRAAIVRELRNKAESTQRPIRDFLDRRGARSHSSLWSINGIVLTARADVVRELAADPQVAQIELDELIPLYDVVYSAATAAEWNIDAIHAGDLWGLGYRGQRVVVANMDTGVDLSHPDLSANWRGGRNSWLDPYSQSPEPYDPLGHGTETMGVMVGGSNGGTAIGVAPKAKWIAVKIFSDSGVARTSAIHEGFQWLLDPDGNPETDDAPDVVNNSWGSTNPNGCAEDFLPDIQVLEESGIAVVFAAGNDGPGAATSSDPANNPGVFSVGATGSNSAIASFSSRGPSACDGSVFPQVVAPGAKVRTSSPGTSGTGGSYSVVDGTSFAAPHAAGAMALLLSAFPGLTVPQLQQALIASARDLGEPGPDNSYGNGLINALNAYNYLSSNVSRLDLVSQAGLDGWIREASQGAAVGGGKNSVADLVVGDNGKNNQFKCVLSFDTGSIPPNAVITSATLVLERKKVLGANPFGSFGPCHVDIATGSFNGVSLQKTDFQAAPAAERVAVLSNPKRNGAKSQGVLNEAGLKSINKGGTTQFRVHFKLPTDNDDARDMIMFWGDNGAPEQKPGLLITYSIP